MGMPVHERERKPYFVYRLRCPLSKLVRYIGISHQPKQRAARHRVDPFSYHGKHEWILGLREHRLAPILEVISPELRYQEARSWELRLHYLFGVMYPGQLCCAPVKLFRKKVCYIVLSQANDGRRGRRHHNMQRSKNTETTREQQQQKNFWD